MEKGVILISSITAFGISANVIHCASLVFVETNIRIVAMEIGK